MDWRSARTAAVVAAVLALSACTMPVIESTSDPDTTPVTPFDQLAFADNPRAITGPATARLTTTAIEPVGPAPQQQLPVTVTSFDASGTTNVTVTDTSRVVAIDIAGSLTATIWGLGLGDTLVGKDISTTFPGTEDIPVVTAHSHTVNTEAILALEPTLVITDGTIGPRGALEQLRDAGVPVVFVRSEPSFEGAQDLARQVAAIYGADQAGELLAERIAAEVSATRAAVAAVAPVEPADRVRMMFVYIRGNAGIYYVFGEESGTDELIEALGGVDAAKEAGITGMRPLTDEAMVAANPDVILMMTKGLESSGGVDGLLEARPAIALTNAGVNRRIIDMADGDILAFGPRSALVIEALARAIYVDPEA